jgi:hypothetical protein
VSELQAELRRLLDVREARPDWDDVLRRAGGRPSLRRRRVALVLGAALVLVLAAGSALALTGRLPGLFHGTPVRDLTPFERFYLEDTGIKGTRVELVATQRDRAFYVIRGRHGICYAIGSRGRRLTPAQAEEESRFGALGCVPRSVFPSRLVPILDFSGYAMRLGGTPHLVRLEGFAADPVARVGAIGRDNRVFYSVAVTQNVYSGGRAPAEPVRGLVAFDSSDRPVYVECHARGGCGKFRNTPRPRLPSTPPPRPVRPAHPVSQHGEAAGATVDVRGVDLVLRLASVRPEVERLLATKRRQIVVQCLKSVRVAGKSFVTGSGSSVDLAPVVRISLFTMNARVVAPFDGCTVSGMYGHRWNDAHGMHDAIEIPLTPRGRRYFADRAAARDIAWLVRSRQFQPVRYHRGAASARALADSLPRRVVPLASPSATPASGTIGLWVGPRGRLLVVDRALTGRRLWIELRGSRVWRTNVSGLASAF